MGGATWSAPGESDPTHITGDDIAADLPGDVVDRVARGVPGNDLELADDDLLAVPRGLQLPRRHALGLSPQGLEPVAVEPLGARQELGAGIDQVRHPGRMGVDRAAGASRQNAGATRVVEMDVGGEDRRQIVNRETEFSDSLFHRLDRARRPALEEDEATVAGRRGEGCDHLAESLESEVDGGEFFHPASVHGSAAVRPPCRGTLVP